MRDIVVCRMKFYLTCAAKNRTNKMFSPRSLVRTLLRHPVILNGKEVKRNIVFRSAKDSYGETTIAGRKVSVVLVKRSGRTVGVVR